MRQVTKWSTTASAEALDRLLANAGHPSEYRQSMYEIGRALANDIAREYGSPAEDVTVVCTAEDADFLAKGLIDRFEERRAFKRIHLMCFWNDRQKINGFDIAPVLRKYKEPTGNAKQTLVILKSIISGACVVKTNLTNVLGELQPERILVVAPVMLEGAEDRLSREFPEETAQKFIFVTYAVDDAKDGENVIPGIGGNVYDLLGFGSAREKYSHTPRIVSDRRARLHHAQ